MNKWTTLILSTFVALTLVGMLTVSGEAQQPPPLPHAFYGGVEINGQPAPVGTMVEARGQGVLVGIPGNPVSVSQPGRYGGPGGFDPKLVVQGNVVEGTQLTFYVNGIRAQCAVPGGNWQDSFPFHIGGITELNLRITQEGTITPIPTVISTVTASPTRGVATATRTVTATPGSTGTVVAPLPTSTGTPAGSAPIVTNTPSITSIPGTAVPSALVSPTPFIGSSPVVASTPTVEPGHGRGVTSPSSTILAQVQQVTSTPSPLIPGISATKLSTMASTSVSPASTRAPDRSSASLGDNGFFIGWILVLVALVVLGIAGFVAARVHQRS